ncbi:DUF5686 and carboxypeptidase-like regulatory domain-containing protein [Parabacteroides johnsonii]|jgi:hypothetical protein|uniref:Collagen-binding protein n=1 Tax=Parabacteroides johnsonii TaxID=387661 RepID=A0A9Q5SN71_9BACT|nr:DUF5686 and carboxypeptidase-like regulatory domain-containing protein [Parabacteroides johnsonii]OUO01949.1 collagen-binding protein [Parabacteroides johnsonii]CCX76662.1 putative uncharacterized protein [Parabacteroides johnsonii CAG:246]
MGKKIVFLLASLFTVWIANGQNTIIKGIVTDSITGEGLPYVSLIFKGTTIGTATDGDGNFSFSASTGVKNLEVSYLGYDTKEVKVIPGKTNNLKIKLAPNGITLNEVVVKPKKEKYSKKENPAVKFVKQVIASRESNDPRNHDYFQYDQYEKMVFAMNDYHPKPKKNGKPGKFDFLIDFVDTLDVGTTILPVSEKEKVESVYYRKDPKSEKRLVKGNKSSGVDEIFSRDGIQQFLNEVFREVDIFKNDIPLFLQRFVSPLSTIGPNYYKYYLLDTLNVNGQKCVDLGFVPFNSETFGFTGHLFVTLDSTFFVQKAILNVPKDINLNFVSGMTIEQTFERTSDSTRIITKDDINVNFKLSEKSKGMYARRLNIYSNHSFDEPDAERALVFKESAPVITLKDAYQQSEDFWTSNRPEEAIKKNPNSVEKLMAKFRSVPLFYITEKVVSVLVSGYIPTNKDPLKSKFEFGPMNTAISGNAIEGARFRVGGTTTTAFSKNLFFDGYMAYGTKDEKLKYDALVEYSFNDRKEYRKEFPLNSIRLEYMYDINQLGQQYMYASKDNMFLAWKRQKDTRATYLRQAELTYYHEHYNGLAYGAVVRNRREYATEYAVFDRIGPDGTISPVKSYDMTELELKFRYAKDEKFYQTRNLRYPITFDALIFNFSHVMAKKDLLGSSYDYHRTDIGIQKRFWFSAFGYIDLITKAGKVWNKVPYPLLILPNANLSYTIQPESYTNMNAMEFISDEYASWDLTYYMNGNLLNRLPLVKKLKWREVFCFRGLWGHLTDKNNPMNGGDGLYLFPDGSYTLGKAPYMEASVGIENIFKFLRLDYVWRLNYRDHPGIQTKGVRFMMRMSF